MQDRADTLAGLVEQNKRVVTLGLNALHWETQPGNK